MFTVARILMWLALATLFANVTAQAQSIFELPNATAGESYRAEIAQVLRDTYRLKLDTSNQNAVIQWAFSSGSLPEGLSVRTDGFVVGKPIDVSDKTYVFRVNAIDTAARNDVLTLEFALKLKGGGLRLVSFQGPTLTPLDVIANTTLPPTRKEPGSEKTKTSTDAAGVPQASVLAWKEPPLGNSGIIPHFTEPQIDLGISVKGSSRICMLYVEVKDKNRKATPGQQRVDANKDIQKIQAGLAKGDNTITVIPYANKKASGDCSSDNDLAKFDAMPAEELTLTVTCDGPNCGENASAPGTNTATGESKQNPFSSLNRRLIVGFEQSGAASADTKGNPFIDLFINTPLPLGQKPDDSSKAFPRFSIWGYVRLNSTPQQVAALADVSSAAVTSIKDAKINKLTQAFDFAVGPELRLFAAGRTHVSLIAGFGAISPLSPTDSTQIFKTPNPLSSQGPAFYTKYPSALGKENIAFTGVDRDRFLRQYYGGVRFKTYSFADGKPKDWFPGMLDITFGQSEAVTGGTFHKFVVGIDGFYSLPFPNESRFLYLFGSARFKAGGPKTKETPFILDTASSSVSPTDLNVFVTSRTPSNRDYYRLGFGVDLIELFNFAKNADKDK